MSLSDKMKEVGSKPGVAPAAPVAPSAGISKPNDAVSKGVAFRARGAQARANMSEDQKVLEGSKSDKVVLLATLGNPAKSQPRKKGGDYIASKKVCGYQIKVLEDTTVPVAPLKENCVDELDVQTPPSERAVKAGEIVNLNVMETALMISRIEYGGSFTGEGTSAYITATISKSKENPSPCLRTLEGSIKENMIMVAEMVGQKDGKGGHAEVKEEFKEFAPLFRKRSAKRAGSGNGHKAGEAIKDTAAAFRVLFSQQ